jgi:hypothetical protein
MFILEKVYKKFQLKRTSYVKTRLGRHVTPHCKRDPLEKPKNQKKKKTNIPSHRVHLIEAAHKKSAKTDELCENSTRSSRDNLVANETVS